MTPKQREFCRRYVHSNVSPTQAAIDAGYSEYYAKSKGLQKLMNHPEVQAEVRRLRARLNEQADKSATDVVNEYARIAFTDRTTFLKPDPDFPGSLIYKAPEELTGDQRALVEKVTAVWQTRTRIINGEKKEVHRQEYTYQLLDKANALQQMGRHFGIFDDKIRLTGPQQNPFKNASPAQLEALKKSFIGVMTDPKLIEGEYEEVGNDG